MIKCRFSETETGTVSLSIKGHAGAAEVGQDIVCAAASILAYTVAQLVNGYAESNMLKRRPILIMKKGSTTVTCRPKEEYYDEVRHSFFVARTGLNLLAHNYPEYVTLKAFGRVKQP